MKKSQAFAMLRESVIQELQFQIQTVLVPEFNSEVKDIEVEWENGRKVSEALADHRKRARVADLIIRRDSFLESLNNDLRLALNARVKLPEYSGEISEIEIPISKEDETETRKVLEVKFNDGSRARMPRSLWVDYKAFQRV